MGKVFTRWRLRKWLRWSLLIIAAVVLTLVGVGYFLTRPGRLNVAAAGVIAQMTGRRVTVQATELGWDSVTLKAVTVSVPGSDPKAERLFFAKRIKLRMRPWAAVFGHTDPQAIELDALTIYLTENLDKHRFNYEQLRLPPRQRLRALPRSLPEVVLRGATIRFGQVSGGRYRGVGTMHMEGLLDEAAGRADMYRFVLRQVRSPKMSQGHGPKLSGTIDTRTMRVEMNLERFSFTKPQRSFLPYRLRQWWDRLKPKGSLPTVGVEFRAGADRGLHLYSAKLVVHDVSMTLPWDQRYHPRMKGVSGRFTVKKNVIRVVDLRGRIAGIRYTINGRVDGFEADAPFLVSAETRQFTVPTRPRYIFAMPPVVQEQYKLLSPTGTFKVKVAAMRRVKGGPIEYSGQVRLIDARAQFEHFPYPVHHLKGLIRFDKNQLRVVRMTGVGPSGAKLKMDEATITPPDPGAAVRIRIEGWNVPIDHYLFAAMQPRYRKAIGIFLDKAAKARLVKAGLIGAGTGKGRGKGKARGGAFKLGGVIRHLTLSLSRPRQLPGRRAALESTTTLEMAGLQGIFKFWPYPLRCTGGTVTIGPHEVSAEHVVLRGLSGGSGVVNGTVDTGTHNSELVPHLTVSEVHLPIDALLLGSIPSPQDQWLDKLGLHGTLGGRGRIFKRGDGRIGFSLRFDLAHGWARPLGGSFVLKDLTGGVELRRSRVDVRQVVGRHGDSRIGVTGQVDWRRPGAPRFDLHVAGLNLGIDQSLIDLVPKANPARVKLTELMRQYHPAGRLNATLDYRTHVGQTDAYRLCVTPRSMAFDLGGKRLTMSTVWGQIEATGQRITLKSLGGRIAGGPETLMSGTIDWPSGDANLQIAAHHDRFGAVEHAVLPRALVRVLDRLQWRGGYDLRSGQVRYRPRAPRGAKRLSLDAKLDMLGDSMRLGAALTDMYGRLNVRVGRVVGQASPAFRLVLADGRAKAWGRAIGPLTLTLVSDPSAQAIQVQRLRAKVYGGVLVGSGLVQPGRGGVYQMHLTLEDAGLEGILHPVEQAKAADAAARAKDGRRGDDDRGTLSASLTIGGRNGDPSSHRGRGIVQVRGARLYDQPLALALLQAANFSLPTSSSFDRAAAAYLIRGDEVRLNPIRFEAPSLEMAGTGTMELPGGQLHLQMFLRNPRGPMLGVLSEMVNVFKDELVCVQVSGTLGHPVARNVSFEGIRQTFDQIFSSGGARERPTGVVRAGVVHAGVEEKR